MLNSTVGKPSTASYSVRVKIRLRLLRITMACTFCLTALVLPLSVTAQKPQNKGKHAPAAPSHAKANLEVGRVLFQKNCSPCHGTKGQGGEGPSLQKQVLTDAGIRATIKNGVKGEMPAFGSKFKSAEINALSEFVRSLKTSR